MNRGLQYLPHIKQALTELSIGDLNSQAAQLPGLVAFLSLDKDSTQGLIFKDFPSNGSTDTVHHEEKDNLPFRATNEFLNNN